MENAEKPPAIVRWPASAVRSDIVRLHMAVLLNKSHKVSKYVKLGTSVDSYNQDGQPPIFCAALLGKARAVKTLLEYGANPNARCNPEGCTPVHAAAYVGCAKSLKLLLMAGGDLRLTDIRRRTPLDWANLQVDDDKRRNIRDILDGARICAFKPTGKEMLLEWEKRINCGKTVRHWFSFPCYPFGTGISIAKDPQPAEVKLKCNVIPIGYGKVYFGTDRKQRCGAVVGLPLINEISDLKLAEDTTSASWICGKFSTFVPMVWHQRKTSVTVRELRKTTVEDAIPDILIAELDSLVKLQHPNILMIMAVCFVDNYDSISLVFEKIQMGSLFFVLYNQLKRLSSILVMDLVIQVSDALQFIHASGYLHGFVNSHSIFLVDNYRAKLGCLEYVTPIAGSKEELQTSQHPLLRSDQHLSVYRHWAAPEVITGSEPASVLSDVYSLCCVIWELIYGEVPWKDYTLKALRTMMTEIPDGKLPLDAEIVPALWYHVLDAGLCFKSGPPHRDLEVVEIRDIMKLSKSRMDVGAAGDGLQCKVSSSRNSLKSQQGADDPIVESHDAVDADKIYQLSLYGPQTAV